jgi:histidinol-phosphate aminotransferase
VPSDPKASGAPGRSGRGALPLRPELLDQVPYGAPQLDVLAPLNVNENPYPPSEAMVAAVRDAVAEAARGLNRYPDREALHLRGGLADYLGHGLTAGQVWAANGSNEVMLHLLGAFGGPGRTAVSFAPTYSMYPEYARNTHTRWVTGHRREDFGLEMAHVADVLAAEQPSVVLLTSPNNPTGTALPLDHVREVLRLAPQAVVIVDEAYAEFRRPTTPTALELLGTEPRLAVTRTMSKAFALAGARLGYVAASSDLVDCLRIVRLPYHLSAVTQAVAVTALQFAGELTSKVDELRDRRDDTGARLRSLGYTVAESDANFLLFGRFGDRHQVWQDLLDRSVLIRETGPEGWLRVSIGTADQMEMFFSALAGSAAARPLVAREA